MFSVDRGATQLQNLAAHVLIGRKVEFLLGVVAEILRGCCAGLHAVSAHDSAGRAFVGEFVLDQQVFAEEVELVGIEAGPVGSVESFAQFDIEDFEAQPADRVSIGYGFGQSQPITAYFRVNPRLDRAKWKQGRQQCRLGYLQRRFGQGCYSTAGMRTGNRNIP